VEWDGHNPFINGNHGESQHLGWTQ
jgi:hypothetical protein